MSAGLAGLVGRPVVARAATASYAVDASRLGNQRLSADSAQDRR